MIKCARENQSIFDKWKMSKQRTQTIKMFLIFYNFSHIFRWMILKNFPYCIVWRIGENLYLGWIDSSSSHGLRTPRERFFSKNPNFLALAEKFWGIWGIVGRLISTHFGTVSPLFMFSINQALFLQNLSLYIQISNIYLGLGFEFGLQRIWDLAIMCK